MFVFSGKWAFIILIVKSHDFKTVLYHKASLSFLNHSQVTKFQITSEKNVFFSIIQVSGFRFIVADIGWSKWKFPFKFRSVHISLQKESFYFHDDKQMYNIFTCTTFLLNKLWKLILFFLTLCKRSEISKHNFDSKLWYPN